MKNVRERDVEHAHMYVQPMCLLLNKIEYVSIPHSTVNCAMNVLRYVQLRL